MEKNRKKFILSADDFGISPLANKNILSLVKAKKIDRVSLMADGTFTLKELEKIKQSGIKIDLHLDITHSKKKGRSTIESAFLRGFLFSLKLTSRSMRSSFIEIDWENQIEKFHRLMGRYPDGLNSHQHIHYFPPYFKIILKLAKKRGISFIRFGKDSLIPSNANVYRILFWLHKKNKATFLSSHLQSSAHLISLDWIKNPANFLSQTSIGSTEIVCHPERKKEFEIIHKYF